MEIDERTHARIAQEKHDRSTLNNFPIVLPEVPTVIQCPGNDATDKGDDSWCAGYIFHDDDVRTGYNTDTVATSAHPP